MGLQKPPPWTRSEPDPPESDGSAAGTSAAPCAPDRGRGQEAGAQVPPKSARTQRLPDKTDLLACSRLPGRETLMVNSRLWALPPRAAASALGRLRSLYRLRAAQAEGGEVFGPGAHTPLPPLGKSCVHPEAVSPVSIFSF